MARKLFTTLGTGPAAAGQRYQPTRYCWQGQLSDETEFFALALADWFRPERVYIFLTEQARASANWTGPDGLEKQLTARGVAFVPVSIPDGRSEQELWRLFDLVAQCVEPGDRLIFDITHGFRSLPLVLLLAAVYLRAVREAQLEHLLYGAHEAREGGVTPVFDLTPMVELLDWLAAADMFRKTGDARDLAARLDSAHRRSWQNPAAAEQARALQCFASVLKKLSAALVTIRPAQVQAAAQAFSAQLEAVRPEAGRFALPLVPLLEQIERTYGPLAAPGMAGYRALVELYSNHGRIPQALLLARELVVEEACRRLGRDAANLKVREEVEDLLGEFTGKRAAPRPPDDPLAPLQSLWDQVGNARNNLAHCGFGHEPASAQSIIRGTQKIVQQLQTLLAEPPPEAGQQAHEPSQAEPAQVEADAGAQAEHRTHPQPHSRAGQQRQQPAQPQPERAQQPQPKPRKPEAKP
jgi:CRISPR-associated DxTHG motif protein